MSMLVQAGLCMTSIIFLVEVLGLKLINKFEGTTSILANPPLKLYTVYTGKTK